MQPATATPSSTDPMDSTQRPKAAKGPLITPEMTAAGAAAALPIASQSNGKAPGAKDDDSDWEYEYSSTETEVCCIRTPFPDPSADS